MAVEVPEIRMVEPVPEEPEKRLSLTVSWLGRYFLKNLRGMAAARCCATQARVDRRSAPSAKGTLEALHWR